MKVLIVYYSTYGNVFGMAKLVSEGVGEVDGAEPVLRRVPGLMPESLVESNADMKAARDAQKDVALVTVDDFKEAGAIAFGTPTRFGNVSAQLKNQIDQLSGPWLRVKFRRKTRGRLRLYCKPPRRTGDDGPYAHGPAPAFGVRTHWRSLLGKGTFYDNRRRLSLRAGPYCRTRRQEGDRSRGGGDLPRLRAQARTDRPEASRRAVGGGTAGRFARWLRRRAVSPEGNSARE